MSGSNVQITWKTATETNNDFFTVEKSNGTDFKEVAKLEGKGNSAIENTYSVIDDTPFSGTSYYRLKQTDLDGQSTYSKAVAVKNEPSQGELVLFPNPNGGTFKLQVISPAEKVELVVFNQHGTVSLSKVYSNQQSGAILQMDLAKELLPGVYYLQISCGRGDLSIQKIVIS